MSRRTSVIIPSYNCAHEIRGCVETVLKGTCLPLEVLVVDDCSSDATRQVAEALAVEHPGVVRALATARNGGPGRTRNVGARAARGEYLFFLDSDVTLAHDSLERFERRIEECDAVVGIYTDTPTNSAASAWYKALLYAYLLGESGVQPYDQFSASCAGLRASVFSAVGGWDEWFEAGVDLENEELGHRLSSRYRMLLDPLVRGAHAFPGFAKSTRIFFLRTALWVEMFLVRRRFSTLAGTPQTGMSSMALLGTVVLLPLAALWPWLLVPLLALYGWYLYGYAGFFAFVARRRPRFLAAAIVLNHWYTLVIAAGAVLGGLRYVTGRSVIARRFSASRTG